MHETFETPDFEQLLETLRADPAADSIEAWPETQLAAMASAGVMKWEQPAEFGGLDLRSPDMLEGLRLLSSCCLVSTFVLTQRSAAVRRISTSANEEARQRLLPDLLQGKIFATVGISHLTTSGQHLKKPLVSVEASDGGFVLNGLVPWATSAARADHLITGGTLDDGRQILAAIPTSRRGLHVQPPMRLMALNSSQTGAVKLNHVTVDASEVLHGPIEGVMQQGTGGGAGSLGTSALAIGATEGTLRHFAAEAEKRSDLDEYLQPLLAEHDQLMTDLRLAALGEHADGPRAAEQIRRAANSLVLRSAQAWLAATKGLDSLLVTLRSERCGKACSFWSGHVRSPSCPQIFRNSSAAPLGFDCEDFGKETFRSAFWC